MNLCWYVQSCLSSTWFKCSGRGTSCNIWGKLLLITAKRDGKGNCVSGDYLLPFGFCFLVCSHYCAFRVLWEYIGNEHILGGLGFFFFIFLSTKRDLIAEMCVWPGICGCAFVCRSTGCRGWRVEILTSCVRVSKAPLLLVVLLIENCGKLFLPLNVF